MLIISTAVSVNICWCYRGLLLKLMADTLLCAKLLCAKNLFYVFLCCGLNCVLQKDNVEALAPGACECDLTWKQDLCRCDQLQAILLGWALIQYHWRSYKKRTVPWKTETHRESAMWQQRSQGCSCRPRNTKDWCYCQKLGRHKRGFCLYPKARREHGLADSLISDVCIQDCREIHFCCFKPPSLWYLDPAALGN